MTEHFQLTIDNQRFPKVNYIIITKHNNTASH